MYRLGKNNETNNTSKHDPKLPKVLAVLKAGKPEDEMDTARSGLSTEDYTDRPEHPVYPGVQSLAVACQGRFCLRLGLHWRSPAHGRR